MIFWQLFFTFFKIGLFGFGGGYAMLSMIQAEVVTAHDWISATDFTDIVAISQMTPGAIGINASTYIGYTAVEALGYSQPMCLLGSFCATSAVVLPSFFMMIVIGRLLLKYNSHEVVDAMFRGLRPAVVGLLAAAALVLMTPENFGTSDNQMQRIVSVTIFLSVLVGSRVLKLNSILLIVLSGLVGLIVF